jgi:hypothetical protein
MMREKCSYSFLRLLVKGQDHSFFKNLTGIFCTVGGTLVKNLFQNQQAKFNQLGTNYSWVKGIQVCLLKGPGALQRGDDHKNV